MINEKEINQINEMKHLLVVEPVLMPILLKQEQIILHQIYNDFKADKTDFLASVARFCQLRDLIFELETVKKNGMRASIKLDQETNKPGEV